MTAMVSNLSTGTSNLRIDRRSPQNNLWTACDSNNQVQEFVSLFSGSGLSLAEVGVLAGQFQICMDNT